MNRKPLFESLAVCLALALAAPAARAEWLVTKEGARFETKGPWTVKGKLIVFTLPNGSLSSLRAEQIDLEASKRAEEEVKAEKERAAAPAPEKPKRASVRILTDKDFRKAEPPQVAPAEGEAAPAEEAADPSKAEPANAAATPAGAIEVVDWKRVEETDYDGVQLQGKVRNGTATQALGVMVVANFYDEAGTLVAQVPAELETGSLAPGASASFVVSAPGTYSFSGVKFQAKGQPLKTQGRPAPEAPNPPGSPEG